MWAGLYIAIVCVVGAAALSLLAPRRRGLVEFVGLSLVLGLGTTGTLMLWLSMLGLAPTRGSICVIGLLGAVWIGLTRRVRVVAPEVGGRDFWLLVPIVVATYLLCVVIAGAWMLPLAETDAFVIWGFKAKVLSATPLVPRPAYFMDVTLSFSHLDYPLLVPMLRAGALVMTGPGDDGSFKLLCPVAFVALGALIYANGRRRLDRLPAALIACIILGAPAMIRWAGVGVADVTVALFAAGAIVGFTDRRDVPITFACCALLAMTKLEGMVLAGLFALAITCVHPARRTMWSLLLGSVTLLPWIAWSWNLPRTHEQYASRALSVAALLNGDRIWFVVKSLANQFLDWHAWGALWPMLLLAVIAGFGAFRTRSAVLLWAVMLLQILAYALAYVVTPWDLGELIPMTLHRLLIQITPVAAALVALHWGQLSDAARS